MTLAVPHSASITSITLRSPAEGSATAGYDATGTLLDAALEQIEAVGGSREERWTEHRWADRAWGGPVGGGTIGRGPAWRGPAYGGPIDTHRLESVLLIIAELRAALDLRRGGAIAANVDDLYDYMCRRLRSAGVPNGPAALHEVSHLLHALRSVWAFLTAEVHTTSGN